MYKVLLLFCLGLFFGSTYTVFGQISDGGKPLEILKVKSAKNQVITMPAVNNFQLLKASVMESSDKNKLKPFRFAHTFSVNINPQNSGTKYENIDGYNVWQVTIKSKDALSLNVIFDPYHIPPGAKLYILNAEKNKKLGAFTDFNNKSFGTFAVMPVAGDEITIQYEEPIKADFIGEIGISKVNHDFYGVVASGTERRPKGLSGSCNVDINCELADEWQTLKNSVCRIFIDGTELCTGTLLNNTAQDENPYILTANHCYKNHVNGEQNSIFLFNYQSPYCGALDGDNSNTISGSIFKANSDSLDFQLVELTIPPPPEYRPYYAGWDNSGTTPNSAVSIHHPLGDIKKIAMDFDSPIIDSFKDQYIDDAFWKTLKWDEGTTEVGSSGGGYFNENQLLVGTLTGGEASCSNSINDYFSRIDISWDYYDEPEKQLKHWLDPSNSNVQTLNGLAPYDGIEYCDAFTNMKNDDSHQLVEIMDGDNTLGYWGGSNDAGITEFMEKFSIDGNEIVEGVSLGLGLLDYNVSSTGFITVNVYNGTALPEVLIYSQDVSINEFVNDAMNFIGFADMVEPSDTFFIGFNISNLQQNDKLAVYQSFRENREENTFYLKLNDQWSAFSDQNSDNAASSLAFEVVACNVFNDTIDVPNINDPVELDVFPNPTSSFVKFDISKLISVEDVFVYDILGKQVNADIERLSLHRFKVTLNANRSGVYFLRIQNEDFIVSRKISYLAY